MRHARPCYFVTVTFRGVATRVVREEEEGTQSGCNLNFCAGKQAGDRRQAWQGGPK